MAELDHDDQEKDEMCPQCAKQQEHVKMVETKGKVMECPKCHYFHLTRRA